MADTATTLEHLTVPAVEDATTTPRTQRKQMNRDERLIANARSVASVLRTHSGYASTEDLAALEQAAKDLETAASSYIATKAGAAEKKKQARAEGAAARTAITREVRQKTERIDAEAHATLTTKEQAYTVLNKLFAKVNLSAKQQLLTDENPHNDAIAATLKKM